MEMGIGVLERLEAVFHGHQDPDVVGGARAAHVGTDDGREEPPGPGQQGRREGLGHRQGPHGVGVRLLLEGHGEHPLVAARGHQVGGHDGRRPPHPARRVHPQHGLAHRPQGGGQVQLGHHDALEHVGGLADDHGVDVTPVHAGVLEGPPAASRTSPAIETSSRLAACLVWPTPITAQRSAITPPPGPRARRTGRTPGSAGDTAPTWHGRWRSARGRP